MIHKGLSKLLGKTAVSIFLTLLCFVAPARAQVIFMQQLLTLMPPNSSVFEVLPGSDLSFLIDQLSIEILASPTGQAMCGALVENSLMIKQLFFLNNSSVAEALKVCKGKFVLRANYMPHQKHYYIVRTSSKNFLTDGWTTPINETFIVVNNKEETRERLLHTLSHEMAMSSDAKEQIASYGRFEWGLGIVQDASTPAFVATIRNVFIKHALSSLRAFEMESRISAELNVPSAPGLARLPQLSCLEKMAFIWPYVKALHEPLETEGDFNQRLDINSLGEKPVAGDEQELDAVYALTKINLGFTDGRPRINACDYMTQGFPFFASASFHGGPGPRIGEGWSQTLESSSGDKSEAKGTESEFSPEEQKERFKQKAKRNQLIKITEVNTEDKKDTPQKTQLNLNLRH